MSPLLLTLLGCRFSPAPPPTEVTTADTGTNPAEDTADGSATLPDTAIDSEPTLDTSPPLDTTDDDRDGYSEAQGDCDDGNSRVSPDRREWCNRVDDDCDGLVDPGCDENTVSMFWEGYVESDEGGFLAGQYSHSFYDIDMDFLCAYTLELHGEGPTAEEACPSCTWSYATTVRDPEWVGPGCDQIDLRHTEIEAGWANHVEYQLTDYIGYAPSYDFHRGTHGAVYTFGPTVFINFSTGPGGNITEDSHNYYPWGDYQVMAEGTVVSWSRLGIPDYYTYTPP